MVIKSTETLLNIGAATASAAHIGVIVRAVQFVGRRRSEEGFALSFSY